MPIRVRLFGDWGEDSRQLLERLKAQTVGFGGDTIPADQYGDILFVDDDTYEVAIVFNYVDRDYGVPTVSLILEPPEIYPVRDNPSGVRTYSFCDDGHLPAFGLGFATAPYRTEFPAKQHRMAMIVSNKLLTPYHHKRHQIRDALIESDLDIHFYGRGMDHSTDQRVKGEIPYMGKWQVLDQYEFVVDFENTDRMAVTDKYFDPVLCNTVPVTNSKFIRDVFGSTCEYINFNTDVSHIVDRIRMVYDDAEVTDYDLSMGRDEITKGQMSLAKWIEDRVNELHV